jgi:hypothetical protein
MIVQGEERWVPFDPLNHSIDRSYTNAEVLAEMPTEAILREAGRRLEKAGFPDSAANVVKVGQYISAKEVSSENSNSARIDPDDPQPS